MCVVVRPSVVLWSVCLFAVYCTCAGETGSEAWYIGAPLGLSRSQFELPFCYGVNYK